MTNTYDQKPCPPDCMPGIKCDYCSAVNLATALAELKAAAALENPATEHVCCGYCHCGADSVAVSAGEGDTSSAPERRPNLLLDVALDSGTIKLGRASKAIPAPLALAPVPAPSAGLRFFTPAQASGAFGPAMLDDSHCREWVIDQLHPGGARCPHCGLALDDDAPFRAGRRCHCGRCGRWFTATSSTFLEGKHLDYRQVFLLAVLVELMETGLTPQRIADIIGISADTVRLWIKTFKALEAHGG